MRPPAAAVPMRSTVAPRANASSTLATTGTSLPTPTHSAASLPALVESTTATTSNGAYRSTPIAVFAVAGANWPSARIATFISAEIPPLAQESPVSLARRLAMLERHSPVHDHVFDADRVPVWIVVCRCVDHAIRIEDDEVGPRTPSDHTTVADPRTRSGEGGHLADRILETEHLLVARVAAKH